MGPVTMTSNLDWKLRFGMALVASAVLVGPGSAQAGQAAGASDHDDVTFTKDIAPILQRSCQHCHQPDSVAPMSLISYEDARPWARAMKMRTSMGPVAGVMPPWYVERDIGIQEYQFDPSLSDEEVAKIATWADNGAPRGNPADMPPPKLVGGAGLWALGEPDLITETEEVIIGGDAPDWWGEITPVDVGLNTDRYVASVEIREVNDVLDTEDSRETVGGRFVFHHMVWSTVALGEDGRPTGGSFWPVHEVGRNPDVFDPEGAPILHANSKVMSDSTHLHSNGRDTRAHLEIGWRFHPEDYEPKFRWALRPLGNGVDIDIQANRKDQQLHAYYVLPEHTKITTFEPHLHAPGARMCLEAIWGINVETLTCAGYDHNWVRGYQYAHGYEPLLPKGTILHITGEMDNTAGNRNIPDPRNWQGSGNRSVANMFIDLGNGVSLTDEQFETAMNERREMHGLTRNDHVIGCPLCPLIPVELDPAAKLELVEENLATAKTALEEAEAEAAAAKAEASGANDQQP